MKKRHWCALIALLFAVLFTGLLSGQVKAAGMEEYETPGWDQVGEYFTEGDWKYRYIGHYNDNNEKVTHTWLVEYLGNSTSITVPGTVRGKKIYKAELANLSAKTVKVSAGLYRLVISGFNNMTSLTLNSDLTELTIYDNASLSQLTLNNNLKKLTLRSMPLLESLTLNKKLEEADVGAYCDKLQNIIVNDGLKPQMTNVGGAIVHGQHYPVRENVLYDDPFARYKGGFTVSANSSYYKTVGGVLYSKDGSVLYHYPANLTAEHFNVPQGVKYIANQAFFGNDKLKTITFPNGLEMIGTMAFFNSALTSVTIPDSVTYLGDSSFMESKQLLYVKTGKGVGDLQQDGNTWQFRGCTALKTAELSEGLEVISSNCFISTALEQVHLPSTVREIKNAAFGECRSLATVTGGEGLESIDQWAFGRTALKSFPFGSRLRFVSGSAFYQSEQFSGNYPAYLSLLSDLDGDGTRDYYVLDASLKVTGTEMYSLAYEVLDIVNQNRAAQGLSALTMDKELLEAAMQRAAEMIARFDHTRPNGAGFDSVSPKAYSENIALGNSTAASVMDSWMNSATHRANIMNSSMKCVGIGCYVSNGNYYWTQLFGKGEAVSVSKPGDKNNSRTIEIIERYYLPNGRLLLNEKGLTAGDVARMRVGERLEAVGLISDKEYSWYGKGIGNSFSWSSTDSAVAAVDGNGLVTAKKTGSTTIRAKLGDTSLVLEISLQVKPAIEITSQPKSLEASNGTQVQFTVEAEGNGLKYQWQYKDPGGEWKNSGSTGAKTATVSFKALNIYNKKQFRCIITDANGKQLTSNAGTLTMKSAITGQPVNVSASNGEQVQFSVTATGPGLKYQWQYKNPGGNWNNSSSVGAKTATVSFKALNSYNKKQFRCIITDANGKQLTSNAGTLTMKSAITKQPQGLTTTDGTQVKISLTATGPGLKYQWQYRNPGGDWKNSSSVGAKTNTVSFKALSSYNGKQFRCVISDDNGNTLTSNAATLTVKDVPLAINKQPANVTATVGTQVQFSVSASGSGLSYQWQFKDPGGSWKNSSSVGAKTATVKFTVQKGYNGKQYRCIITDAKGNQLISTTATLTVK